MAARVLSVADSCIDHTAVHQAISASVPIPMSTQESVACSAVEMAADVGAKVIIVFTESGVTARLVAKYRPQALIVGISSSLSAVGKMLCLRGVTAVHLPMIGADDSPDISVGLRLAVDRGVAESGDCAVALFGTGTPTAVAVAVP